MLGFFAWMLSYLISNRIIDLKMRDEKGFEDFFGKVRNVWERNSKVDLNITFLRYYWILYSKISKFRIRWILFLRTWFLFNKVWIYVRFSLRKKLKHQNSIRIQSHFLKDSIHCILATFFYQIVTINAY